MSKNLEFEDCILYSSLRSPFARRVRLAFLEHNIPYSEKMLNVLKPNDELIAHNPMSRVPTCILKTGHRFIDSNVILNFFYLSKLESPLTPHSMEDKYLTGYWQGIALGIMDKSIEYFFETSRPKEQWDSEWLQEISLTLTKSLREFSKHIEGRAFIGSSLKQVDLDMGTALEYLTLRNPWDWPGEFPAIKEYLENLKIRSSFQKTQPPPVP